MTAPFICKLQKWLRGILLTMVVMPAYAATELQASPPVDPAEVDTAYVVVNGEGLFRVRGISAFPARERAAQIAMRIESLARDAAFDPAKLTVTTKDGVILIAADALEIMRLVDEDAALEGVQKKILADVYRAQIREVIIAYRHDRQPKVLMMNGLYALIGTLILIGMTYLTVFLFRRLRGVLERYFQRRIKILEEKSLRIVQAEQIWEILDGSIRLTRLVLVLVLAYVYLSTVLSLFPWTRWFATSLLNLLLNPLEAIGKAVFDYLPSLFFLVILILIARYILKLLRIFFNAVAMQRIRLRSFDADWAWPTYRIVRLIVIAFTVVVAYPYIPGSETAAFKGVSLFLGVLFSLGSTAVISNVIAGYTMTYRRAFKVGDWIKIENTMGRVEEIRLLVTHLRTFKNEEIIIPNSKILNTEIINYSVAARGDGLILHTLVGIGYETPWRQVEAMLLLAAERTSGLRTDRQAYVLQKSLGDFAVNYELNVFIDDAMRMPHIYTELHRHTQDVFNEYKVQIMTPAYERDTAEPKIVAKENWYAAPAKPPDSKPV